MTNQKHQDDQNGGVNPVAAGVVGAVVGAVAVGVAGAAVMANDDSRKAVEKVIDQAKDKAEDAKKTVEEKIAQGQEKVNEAAASVKNLAEDVLGESK